MINSHDILKTISVTDNKNLNIRTITMGIFLLDCVDSDQKTTCDKMYDKTRCYASNLVKTGKDINKDYGIPIINKRISATPISMIAAVCPSKSPAYFAQALDRATKEAGINFIDGYSVLIHKDFSPGGYTLIESIPGVLNITNFVCSSTNVGTIKTGINMNAVGRMKRVIRERVEKTADRDCTGATELVIFCNAPGDNPSMAGTFYGPGEPDCVINMDVSGPGMARAALTKAEDCDITRIADLIKKTALKITRMGQLVAQEVSRRLFVSFDIIDLSLALVPAVGGSVAYILEEMGPRACGAHGTTTTLTLLNDAVRKGGIVASSYVDGLSGVFTPVAEDADMTEAACCDSLTLNEPEAMTAVCSVGLDMIATPGDIPVEVISSIIADGMVIDMVSSKTIAVRLISAIDKQAGKELNFGGPPGGDLVMEINRYSPQRFIQHERRTPAPLQSLKN